MVVINFHNREHRPNPEDFFPKYKVAFAIAALIAVLGLTKTASELFDSTPATIITFLASAVTTGALWRSFCWRGEAE